MTEREKMLRGEWYDANYDADLIADRKRAAALQWQFNQAKPDENPAEILKELLRVEEWPAGLDILAPVYFDYGWNTHFSERSFVNHGCYFMDGGGITIGKNAFIGPFCGFYTANHPLDYATRNRGLELAKPIVIGDNCWLGANVTILPGVRIGHGCVIAAGSVVTRDIPDNSVAAGNPAAVKKRIAQSDEAQA